MDQRRPTVPHDPSGEAGPLSGPGAVDSARRRSHAPCMPSLRASCCVEGRAPCAPKGARCTAVPTSGSDSAALGQARRHSGAPSRHGTVARRSCGRVAQRCLAAPTGHAPRARHDAGHDRWLEYIRPHGPPVCSYPAPCPAPSRVGRARTERHAASGARVAYAAAASHCLDMRCDRSPLGCA